MKKNLYFDYNATTPLHPEVKKALTEAMEVYGNPSSLHETGRKAKHALEQAREEIASFINANTEELIFTSGGSESNNSIFNISGCVYKNEKEEYKHRNEVIISEIEHPCILEASKKLNGQKIKTQQIKVDKYGKIDMEMFKKKLSPKTFIVSVIMANNEIGTIQDIKEIARLSHESGALCHTDAVQAVGKLPVDVKDLDVDFLSMSAHKIYGPKGVGALYVKKGIPFCPFILGGHQERNRRAGTENVLGIIGFAKAIQMRKQEMEQEYLKLEEFKSYMKELLIKNIPDILFTGHPEDSLVNTVSVSFYGVEGETLLLYLDNEGIAVSTGSACASGSLDPSHVLTASGVPAEYTHGTIRISMGRLTTKSDIDYMLEKITKIVKRVRSMSTLYDKNHKV